MKNVQSPKEYAKSVGRRLRIARTARDVMQDEFGQRVGISGKAIGNYENGARLVPPATAVAIHDAWGITLDYLYRGEPGGMQYDLVEKIKKIFAEEAERPADAPRTSKRVRRRKDHRTSFA